MKQITPPQLADWLQDATRPAPVLLDVRNAAASERTSLITGRQVEAVVARSTLASESR